MGEEAEWGRRLPSRYERVVVVAEAVVALRLSDRKNIHENLFGVKKR